jgi:hypothetical protein
MKTRYTRFVALLLACYGSLSTGIRESCAAPPPDFVFCATADNDLVRVAAQCGLVATRFDSPAEAVQAAPEGAGVLILADTYPEQATTIAPAVLEEAASKQLRLYIEYPAALPGMHVGPTMDLKLERIVVASDAFGQTLRPMRIAVANACRLVEVNAAKSHLVAAKVAGVDTAVFGLNDTKTFPVLFEHPRGNILVATTKLSHFVTGRYMPQDAWAAIWKMILNWVQPAGGAPELTWTQTVRPSYGAAEQLPDDAELQAVRRAADWFTKARIFRHPDWPKESLDWALTYNTVRDKPGDDWPLGDGSLGMLEGYSSTIRLDGSQPMRYAVRNDCMSEVSMALAFDAAAHSNQQSATIATNLLGYLFTKSPLAQGPSADPDSPSYGLLGWSLDYPNKYWGDDNARALLSVLATSALLDTPQWNDEVARCIVANFRTSGTHGYRISCVVDEELQRRGWESFASNDHVQYSPHYQSWLWACYLWAYDRTGYEPFLTKSKQAIRMLMEAYPERWHWVIRSSQIERARALLPLAWLVRVEDTPEHRRWLRLVATDLLAAQDESGAIRETLGRTGQGVASNDEYGTGEVTIIQQNGDTLCDSLYTCNFALIGLHEAAAATGDPFYANAEKKLADFFCRSQIRSRHHPELDGAWYRGFDFRRWEYWASNADWEWGAWCAETGWGTPWIASTLALRQKDTSLWDLISQNKITEPLERCRAELLPRGAK